MDMINFEQGKIEYCKLNGQKRMFEWVEQGTGNRENEYSLRWDDGTEEWSYKQDIERWLNDYEVDIPVERALVKEIKDQLENASVEELERVKGLISGSVNLANTVWDDDYNNPENAFYKFHDVCTDIQDGLISDTEGTKKLLDIVKQESYSPTRLGIEDYKKAMLIMSKAGIYPKHSVEEFIDFIEKSVEMGLLNKPVVS